MRKGIITALIITAGIIIGGSLIVDYYLKENFGVGLLDIFKFVASSSNTLQSAKTLDEVKDFIGENQYKELASEREIMINQFNYAKENLDEINSNQEVTDLLKTMFGKEYKINLFTIASIGNLSFKVFDWSIKLEDGQITGFENGSPYDKYNVYVQLNQEIARKLMKGEINGDELTQWVKDGSIKINPITELGRFANALPKIMEYIQSK